LNQSSFENFQITAKYFKFSADQGFPLAQTSLGNCFLDGIGVPKNSREAYRLYELAAGKGEEEAQMTLAWSFLNRNNSEAFRLFKCVADGRPLCIASGKFFIIFIRGKKHNSAIQIFSKIHTSKFEIERQLLTKYTSPNSNNSS
jgi:TPR repeat protein